MNSEGILQELITSLSLNLARELQLDYEGLVSTSCAMFFSQRRLVFTMEHLVGSCNVCLVSTGTRYRNTLHLCCMLFTEDGKIIFK